MGLILFILLVIVLMGNVWRWFPDADDDHRD